ncbi:MAG: PqqD family protein [Thermoanaerobaculia bacterium]
MSTDRFAVAPHVEFTEVEGDYVLMDLKSGVYLGLDPVASQIWQSLSDHGDVGRAADELCRRFRVERERALADIETWVGELVERGLLTKEAEAAP